jgi:hypothetical protein
MPPIFLVGYSIFLNLSVHPVRRFDFDPIQLVWMVKQVEKLSRKLAKDPPFPHPPPKAADGGKEVRGAQKLSG